MDPADGVLYAATHYGLFRLPEQGDPVRVADRFQDTMGLPSPDRTRFSDLVIRTSLRILTFPPASG